MTINDAIESTLNLGINFCIRPSGTKRIHSQINSEMSQILKIMLNTHHNLANPLREHMRTGPNNLIPINLVRYYNQQWHKQHAHEPFSKSVAKTAKAQIDNFIEFCSKSIDQQVHHTYRTPHPDIKQHYETIRELIKLKRAGQIIIKKSDKSSKLTIMDKQEYTQKALAHLSDPLSYELKHQIANSAPQSDPKVDPHARIKLEIAQQVINSFNEYIKKPLLKSKMNDKGQILHYIGPNLSAMKFPRIYFLPKTHKPGSPFRPIVSTINWLTENASILIDSILQKELFKNNRCPQLPRDSFSFLRSLCNAQLGPNHYGSIFLVTFDIASLYTSIPQQQASQRAYELLENSHQPQSFAPRLVYNLCQWILKNNYFQFQDRIYHQKHGIAMGNVAGGALANTYLLQWESTFLEDPQLAGHLKFYQRYFDDGFFVWSGDEGSLHQFLDRMNNIDPHIKIAHQTSVDSIQYLDIEIAINHHRCESCSQTGPKTCNNISCSSTTTFLTRSYRKPIATDSYLNFKSAHPYHIRANLPHSILFRAFLTSSDLSTYLRAKQQILDYFINSQYPSRVVNEAFVKFETKHGLTSITLQSDNQIAQQQYHTIRIQLLETTCQFKSRDPTGTKNATPDSKIYLPISFYPGINYRELFNKAKFTEHLSKTKIASHTPVIAFKKPNSLLKLLSRASD